MQYKNNNRTKLLSRFLLKILGWRDWSFSSMLGNPLPVCFRIWTSLAFELKLLWKSSFSLHQISIHLVCTQHLLVGRWVGGSVGWLVRHSVSWLVCWLVGWLIHRSVQWSVVSLVHRLVRQPISRSVGPSVGLLVGRWIGPLVGPSIHSSVGLLVRPSIHLLVCGLVSPLFGWSIGWSWSVCRLVFWSSLVINHQSFGPSVHWSTCLSVGRSVAR